MSYYGSYGSVADSNKYLGIWYNITDKGTTVEVSIEIWFKRVNGGLSDSSNTLYFNVDATTATTSKGTITIDSVSTSTIEKKIATYGIYTYTKGTTAVKHNCAAKWVGIGENDATVSVTNSFTVPALDTFTIAYNANGGENAPDIQEQISGKNIYLTSEKPTRLGYKFVSWNTASDGSGTTYATGSNYTAGVDVTLYAVWEVADCTIYIYKSDLSCKACTFVEGNTVGFDKYGRVLANEFIESTDSVLLGNTMQFGELVEK